MENRAIYITKPDMNRLRGLIEGIRAYNPKPNANLDKLEKELDRAKLVTPKKVPKDVITMNSQVRVLDIDSCEDSTYTIVFPAQANIAYNKISILAPIGTALLGYRVGDIVEWEVPSGLKRLKIEETLYQPEAAGDYHL
ncbi:MAG: nucleoside diphosphate kinase regulator [Proteobacteria bacterium]|nr:nucleoside diphosphate kinase regulator [Pseudomonadota bacterium]MBU4580921.1 nucleoside diphosphate kinase regulator [Pseudomonadota bacterium]MCG2741763.1 nucleoside diphosphate kinase regulator [Syntrophaceae bacterium]